MIKAVIFDLDNTLIPWLDEFDNITKKCMQDNNLPTDAKTFALFLSAMKGYENTHTRFNEEEMSRYFAEYMNLEVPNDFVNQWTLRLYDAIPIKKDQELEDLLEYLSKKYTLFVITNWFTKQQVARLKNYNILKYFNNVYGCDNYDRKPYSEMMNLILKQYRKEEIVYVGDTYEIDIKFATNLGVYSYYITNKEKKKTLKYQTISNIYELKKYL